MQLVSLRKNTGLFNRRSFLVVGQNSDNLVTYLAKILDLECNKKIVIMDPRHSNGRYHDLQNPAMELHEKYNQLKLESMISNWSYCPDDRGVVMILNNCFPRRDHDNIYFHETELLFRKASELNVQLIVAVKRLILPHNYYRFFDFILINEPSTHLAKLGRHFEISSELTGEIAEIPEQEYLFIDNRPDTAVNGPTYYHGKREEIDDEGALLPEVSTEDSCCICLIDYDDGDVMIECRSCGNYGHQQCLLQWYEHNSSCPLCRAGCRLNRKVVFRANPQ